MRPPAAGPDSVDLLASIAEVLRSGRAEDVRSHVPGVFARCAGGFAACFRLHADGAVAEEHWHPANAALCEPLQEPFRAAVKDGLASDDPVHRTPEDVGGANHIWAYVLKQGDRPVAAVCVAAPRMSPLGSPPDFSPLRAAADVIEENLGLRRALAEQKTARDQQDRYFKTLDQQLRILDRERQKFVAVVNQSDLYTFVSDEQYNLRWTNRSTADRLGNDNPGSWMGKPLQEIWDRIGLTGPPAGDESCPVARALRDNEVVHQEFQLTFSGEPRTLYLTGLPVIGPDGRPDEVLVLIQDLSNLETLRRSESRYRLLFERSLDAMLMVDPETWTIVLSNPEASRLLGWDNHTMRGVAMERLHDPGDWERARKDYEDILHGGRSVSAERVLKSTSGDSIIVNMTGMRFDLDGSAVALFEFQDVTEKRRLETELRHSQKMEAIGRLAGGVAHDFNNLLAVIQGQSEMLISKLDGTSDKLSRTAQSVRKAAVRGSLLTRQLLAFSRKDVQKSQIVDVREVVADIEAMVTTLLGGDVELHLELDERPCRIEVDPGQLEQVIMNLAVNSRDAMPDGGNLWIRVVRADVKPGSGEFEGGAARSRRVLLEVRDDGTGMDDMTRSRLFEPFFTTKEQGRGTGLGLSSSYGIVQDCGGTIEVESAVGEGTTFFLHFPRAASERSSGYCEAVATRPTFTHGTETILVVEDEDDVREMAVDVLEAMDYPVLSAACGADALKILEDREQHIDLLLTDVIMPGMSGGDLAREARRIRPELNIMYMSGYTAEDAAVAEGLAESSAEYLQKPFSLDSLSRKVRDALGPAPAAGDA